MNQVPDLSELSKILGDPSRMQILLSLLDGRFYTVTELAKRAKISVSTTSYHLKKLTEIEWLSTYKRGRFVYYHLVDESVAELLEKFLLISPTKTVNSYNQKIELDAIQKARTCYQHLAGELGVKALDFWLAEDYFIKKGEEIFLTDKGNDYFVALGIDIPGVKKESGVFVKLCLDWSERRFHLAGNLGKALYKMFIDKGWLTHSEKDRSVKVVGEGRKYFGKM